MLNRLLTALTSKAAIAVAVGTLAAGAAATAGPALVNSTRPDHTGAENKTAPKEQSDDLVSDESVLETGGDDGAGRGNDEKADKTPADGFGAEVSEDARDGGVDGSEISDRAHERNAERAADRDADDDGERGRSNEHRGDDNDDEGDED